MIEKVEFKMTLFDDESVKKKLDFMDKMEAMFDDSRNEEPNEYYDMINNLPFGATIKITIEVIEK